MFLRNDVAVRLSGDKIPADAVIDFGTADDPRRNLFLCNARWFDAANGGDLVVATSGAGATLQFYGNTWDHAPPTRGNATTGNGTDIVLNTDAPPNIEVGDAVAKDIECPAGRL